MGKFGRWMALRTQRYWRSFSFVGLVVAAVFFALSVTPSLLPRPYAVQGVLSGFALAAGYALGIVGVHLWRFLELPLPSGRWASRSRWSIVVCVACLFAWSLWQMTFWQNSIRDLMQLGEVETAYPYRIGLIAIVCAAILVFLARVFIFCCVWVTGLLAKLFPQRIAGALSVLLVGLIALMIVNDVVAQGLLNAADRAFANLDELIDEGVDPPESPLVTGSPDSLVPWNTIGRRGKNFIAEGPTGPQITEFTGRKAADPIRVYVGLRTRPTAKMRAELAVEELKRVGGFDRSVLVVATPTGTGWLDPSAVDTLEYLHGGDTTTVSIQYSYLPSWMTILVDPNRSREAAHELFNEVYAHWTTMPKDSRPKLYLQGLSLGSMGSETSADLYTIFDDPISGAVWSGPPFPSRRWNELIQDRNPESPAWLPTFRDGSMVRFINQTDGLSPEKRWGSMRNIYIQYASDPMVHFSPDLLISSPEWLDGDRGPDVSEHLTWYPIVTFLQIAFDLPLATTVPMGYGHNYSPASYIDAWIAVTQPADWTDQQTTELKELFAARVPNFL